jgi:hypothetical protein
VIQHSIKEFTLLGRGNIGNDNDQPGMQGLLAIQGKKIGAVIGYKGIVPLQNDRNELPVFGAAKAKIIDVICGMSFSMPNSTRDT